MAINKKLEAQVEDMKKEIERLSLENKVYKEQYNMQGLQLDTDQIQWIVTESQKEISNVVE